MTTTNGDRVVTHRVGKHGEVSVRIHAGRVQVTGTDDESVAVRDLDGRDVEDRFEIERADGRISVRPRERVGFDLGLGRRGRGGAQLAVEVPRHATVSLDAASGDLEVRGLGGEQRYRTASGEIRAAGVRGPIGIDSVSGDVRLEADGPVELSGRLVSGDLEVAGGTLRSVAVATTSGDVEFDAPVDGPGPFSIQTVSGDARVASTGDLRIEARTVTGDITSDLEHRSESGNGRRNLVLGNGSRTLAFRSISGNLHVVGHADAGRRGPVATLADAAMPPAAAVDELAPPDRSEAPAPAAVAPADTAPPDARLAILRDLESGAIDVDTATRRLTALEEAPDA